MDRTVRLGLCADDPSAGTVADSSCGDIAKCGVDLLGDRAGGGNAFGD